MSDKLLKPEKPPKAWWDKCVSEVKEGMPKYTDEQVSGVCGWRWYHHEETGKKTIKSITDMYKDYFSKNPNKTIDLEKSISKCPVCEDYIRNSIEMGIDETVAKSDLKRIIKEAKIMVDDKLKKEDEEEKEDVTIDEEQENEIEDLKARIDQLEETIKTLTKQEPEEEEKEEETEKQEEEEEEEKKEEEEEETEKTEKTKEPTEEEMVKHLIKKGFKIERTGTPDKMEPSKEESFPGGVDILQKASTTKKSSVMESLQNKLKSIIG